jgi:Fuc2NAc and GlcNAc transferase
VELKIAALGAISFAFATVLTGVVRKFAMAYRVLDVPNARSSHVAPTPRGGGLASVLTAFLVLAVMLIRGDVALDVFMASGVGGLAIAAVGFMDDRRPLPAGVRLAVHVAAAMWALLWLGGLPPLQIGERTIEFGWGGYMLGVLGIVWTLNLFNFMDGIDGIAASEAVFVAFAGALLQALASGDDPVIPVAVVFAAACAGFLVWNWPPAQIFMGDVGSGFMGYFIAVLALAFARDNPVALLVWVILGGLFFVDATVTLVRRMSRRESASQAHRSHAYQWLARRWNSHRRVTMLTIATNVFWILPCAWWASIAPASAGWILLLALLPIGIGTMWAGAGRREPDAL